ncbi:hypothetical protein TNCV_1147511 [Trichonephila clavipes]|nr:hypothetical protein TNCV_1147511 [Trichonephila clavipes]
MTYDYGAYTRSLEYQFSSGTLGKSNYGDIQHSRARRELELDKFKHPNLVARAATRRWCYHEMALRFGDFPCLQRLG